MKTRPSRRPCSPRNPLPARPHLALATAVAVCLGVAVAAPAGAHHVEPRSLTQACPPGQVSVGRFSDVPLGSAFELAVSCITDYGIARGVTPTQYDPAGTVARQQMAQFLFRLGTRANISWDTSDAGFRDTAGLSAEARTAVNALANAGIAQGRSPEAFDPAGAVTRGQMASFLARLADAAALKGFTTTRDDFDDDEGVVHEQSINRVAAAGVTAGRGPDRFFDPQSPVTRQQMAAFLARTLSQAVEQGRAETGWSPAPSPARVELEQSGRVVAAGDTLTGEVLGDYITSASVRSSCTGDVPLEDRQPEPGLQFALPTGPQARVGPCELEIDVRHELGRIHVLRDRVLVAGYAEEAELVHVETVRRSPDAGDQTTDVRFVFDEAGTYAERPEAFALVPYADQIAYAASSARQEEPNTVIATFGTAEQPVGPAELSTVSYAIAAEGALVQGGLLDGGEQRSLPGNAILHPGTTSADVLPGPLYDDNLLSVSDRRADPEAAGRFLVDFLFDTPLRVLEAPEHQHYRYDVVLVDGSGRQCFAQDERTRRITVSCDGTGTGGAGGEIARGVLSIEPAGEGATRPQTSSLLTRRPTAAPDVVHAAWGPGEDQLTVTFDEPVHLPRGERTIVRGPTTGAYQGEPPLAEISPTDPTQLVLTLQAGRIDVHNHVQVRGGAVTSRRTGMGNVFEQVPLPPAVSIAVPAGHTAFGRNLLEVTVDEQGVALFRTDTVFFPDETGGGIYASLQLLLRDGREVYCDDPAFAAAESPNGYVGYSSDLVCSEFFFRDSSPLADERATAEQVRTAVYGFGAQAGNIVVVTGARR